MYNNEKHDGQLEKVQPTWYNPENESEEAYCGSMKQKQKYPKYKPWVLERYLDEFYQQEIKGKLKSQPGTSKFSVQQGYSAASCEGWYSKVQAAPVQADLGCCTKTG